MVKKCKDHRLLPKAYNKEIERANSSYSFLVTLVKNLIFFISLYKGRNDFATISFDQNNFCKCNNFVLSS